MTTFTRVIGWDARKNADKLADKQREVAEQQLQEYRRTAIPASTGLLHDAGITFDKDGNLQVDNAYNPYQGLIDSLNIGDTNRRAWDYYGDDSAALFGDSTLDARRIYADNSRALLGDQNSIAADANRLFTTDAADARTVAEREAAAPAYDTAAARLNADYLGRGFTGGDTGLAANLATLRANQAQNAAAAGRDARAQVSDARRNYVVGREGDIVNYGLTLDNARQHFAEQRENQRLGYQVGQAGQRANYRTGMEASRNNLVVQGTNARTNTRQGLVGAGQNSAQGALGTMGGLQGMYASQAQQGQQFLVDLGTVIASSAAGVPAMPGSGASTGRAQSTSLGTTNAQAPSPIVSNAAGGTYPTYRRTNPLGPGMTLGLGNVW